MIDECNKYLPGTSRENIEKCKQHQLAFNQEIEAYVKATEGSDTIVLEPMKTYNTHSFVVPSINVSSAPTKESMSPLHSSRSPAS